MSDRSVQDELIRALADAPYRRSSTWRERELADEDRVERFARFLARHFYYERVQHFFKYSRALASVLDRKAEEIINSQAFEALFPEIVMGSRESARRVTSQVVEHVASAPGARSIPYLSDLLRYEATMMIVEAGPRQWTGNGTRETLADSNIAEVVEGTEVLEFEYDLPQVFGRLLGTWDDIPIPPRRFIRLLFARSPHGRVAVAHAPENMTRLLELAEARRTVEELVREGGFEDEATRDLLTNLVELGALRFSTGS